MMKRGSKVQGVWLVAGLVGVMSFEVALGQDGGGVVDKLKEGVKGLAGSEKRQESLDKAGEALKLAREKRGRELGLNKLKEVANSKEALRLREQAKEAMKRRSESEGAEALVKRATQEAVIRKVKEDVSERAASLIRASAATPPPVPGGGGAFLMAQNTVPSGDEVTDPGNVVVPPKEPAGEVPAEPSKEKVVIKARDAVYFDANEKVAIFEGKVEVDHPGFDIFCDKLEVFFLKGSGAGGAPEPSSSGALDGQSGEIDIVRATGREVLIHKLGTNGKLQIGKCREAIYHAATGRVEMMDFPQVQQGQALIKATERGTKMIFDRNGEMTATGETESLFVKDLKPE